MLKKMIKTIEQNLEKQGIKSSSSGKAEKPFAGAPKAPKK
jgi:hypothetical protein